MYKKAVLVPDGTFRSPLIAIAGWLFLIAAVLAAGSTGCILFSDTFAAAQVSPVSTLGEGPRITWTVLHCSFMVVTLYCSVVASIGLLSVSRGEIVRGTGVIDRGMNILQIIFTATSSLAAVYYVVRMVLYALSLLSTDTGVILLVPSAMAELLLGAQAALIYKVLRRFIDALGHAAASAGYTTTTGVLRGYISMLSGDGLLILSALNLALGASRLIVFTEWEGATGSALLFLPAAMYVFSAAGCCLMGLYLRKYKNTSEYLLYKGKPVEVSLAADRCADPTTSLQEDKK